MNLDLEEIYEKAHLTNIMSQLDELEMSIKAAKMLDQHYIVVMNKYDFEVVSLLEEKGYSVDHNYDYYPLIYTINWK